MRRSVSSISQPKRPAVFDTTVTLLVERGPEISRLTAAETLDGRLAVDQAATA